MTSKQEEVVVVKFKSGTKAPITNINLNKLGQANRHYYRNQKYKEFIVYGVTFQNLKRVLTIRTQYLLKNLTDSDYQLKVISWFDKENGCENKELKAGDCIPIPESYKQSNLQIKLKSDPKDSWSDDWPIYALKHIVKPNQVGYLHHGETYTFFRKQEAEYMDTYNIVLMPPLVLQNCLPVDLNVKFVDSNKNMS